MLKVPSVLKSRTAEGISIFFMILFLYTGASKIFEYEIFREQVMGIPLLKPFSAVVPWLIPLLEFAISVMLFLPLWRRRGLIASACLMICFTVYVIVLFITSPTLPCSCGGIISDLSWSQHLFFNIGCVILAVLGSILQKRTNLQIVAAV
jgi:uncharacterized membrane protein YphA (DoxX/SURF4 family)